jgi:LysM repeat protein
VATAPTPTPVTAAKTYAVKKGDSLYKIAKAEKVTVAQLAQANNLSKTSMLKIGQKLPHKISRYIDDAQSVDRCIEPARREGQEQTEGVAIAEPRIARQIALSGQVFQQEASHPGAKQRWISHDDSPPWHSVRNAGSPPPATAVSR